MACAVGYHGEGGGRGVGDADGVEVTVRSHQARGSGRGQDGSDPFRRDRSHLEVGEGRTRIDLDLRSGNDQTAVAIEGEHRQLAKLCLRGHEAARGIDPEDDGVPCGGRRRGSAARRPLGAPGCKDRHQTQAQTDRLHYGFHRLPWTEGRAGWFPRALASGFGGGVHGSGPKGSLHPVLAFQEPVGAFAGRRRAPWPLNR